MNKLSFTIFSLGLGFFLFFPAVVEGQGVSQMGGHLKHAYQPVVVSDTGWTRARVNNVAVNPGSRLVCVEAWNNATSMKSHLGCLDTDWTNSGIAANWSREFDAPTGTLMPGSYKVMYTYRASDGSWHDVTGMNGRAMNTMYTK